MSKRDRKDQVKAKHYAEFQRQLALDNFREERPQMWLQHMRVMKLVEVQEELPESFFPPGSCFLHANTVTTQQFCVKRVTGIDLDTCHVTVEIYGDDELEEGIAVIPLETVEWFGFPAKAVPVGIHFQGFTGMTRDEPAKDVAKDPAETKAAPAAE